ILTFQNHTNRPLTDFGGKTSIFSHPVYLFLREFSLQDFRGGSEGHLFRVAFAIFFQLSQAAEFQDVPLFPGVFFLPGNKKRVRRGVNVDISVTGSFKPSGLFPPALQK
ncbi:hypothetical protein ABEM16_24005, partial [Escherichia coli]